MARLTLALVCCLAALAAAQPMLNQGDEISDSVIVKMASDTFSVQSSDGAAAADAAGDLGQPIGRNLRRVKVQAGERAQDVADRLAAMPGELGRGGAGLVRVSTMLPAHLPCAGAGARCPPHTISPVLT